METGVYWDDKSGGLMGVEIGWRGQKEWRLMMEKLQYRALRKCTGAVVGAERKLVQQIAAVEDVETFAEAACSRFLARAISDPMRAGVPDPPEIGRASCRERVSIDV